MTPVSVPVDQAVAVPCRIPVITVMGKMTPLEPRMPQVMSAPPDPRKVVVMAIRSAMPGRTTSGVRGRGHAGSTSRNGRRRQLVYPRQQVGRGLLLGRSGSARGQAARRDLSLDIPTGHHQRAQGHHPFHGRYHTADHQIWELKLRLRNPSGRHSAGSRPRSPTTSLFFPFGRTGILGPLIDGPGRHGRQLFIHFDFFVQRLLEQFNGVFVA
jgi:hypothetical protein